MPRLSNKTILVRYKVAVKIVLSGEPIYTDDSGVVYQNEAGKIIVRAPGLKTQTLNSMMPLISRELFADIETLDLYHINVNTSIRIQRKRWEE